MPISCLIRGCKVLLVTSHWYVSSIKASSLPLGQGWCFRFLSECSSYAVINYLMQYLLCCLQRSTNWSETWRKRNKTSGTRWQCVTLVGQMHRTRTCFKMFLETVVVYRRTSGAEALRCLAELIGWVADWLGGWLDDYSLTLFSSNDISGSTIYLKLKLCIQCHVGTVRGCRNEEPCLFDNLY